ncbi:MAG: hypothetical protein ACTSR3_22120, partial [Candidatus Helarchaeota archaeon]
MNIQNDKIKVIRLLSIFFILLFLSTMLTSLLSKKSPIFQFKGGKKFSETDIFQSDLTIENWSRVYIVEKWSVLNSSLEPQSIKVANISPEIGEEVVFGAKCGSVPVGFVYYGNGSLFWDVAHPSDASPHMDSLDVGDVGNDGDINVVIGGEPKLILYNSTGGQIWEKDAAASGTMRPCRIGDIDGDGKNDVAAVHSHVDTTYYAWNNTGYELMNQDISYYGHDIELGDYDNDAADEALVITEWNQGDLILFNESGDRVWTKTLAVFSGTHCLMDDIDFDNDFEMIAVCDGHFYVYNEGGTEICHWSGLGSGRENIITSDIIGNSSKEIIFSHGSNLSVVQKTGATFSLNWSYQFNSTITVVQCADMDQNGDIEIIVTTETADNGLYILNSTGSILSNLTLDKRSGFMDVGNVDSDDELEIVLATADGLFCYDLIYAHYGDPWELIHYFCVDDPSSNTNTTFNYDCSENGVFRIVMENPDSSLDGYFDVLETSGITLFRVKISTGDFNSYDGGPPFSMNNGIAYAVIDVNVSSTWGNIEIGTYFFCDSNIADNSGPDRLFIYYRNDYYFSLTDRTPIQNYSLDTTSFNEETHMITFDGFTELYVVQDTSLSSGGGTAYVLVDGQLILGYGQDQPYPALGTAAFNVTAGLRNITIVFGDDYYGDNNGIMNLTLYNKTIDFKPISNHPNDITTSLGGSETINWQLLDDYGPGMYRVWANDTNDDYYIWRDWTAWSNNSILYVPINRSASGVYNYTIEYND